MADIVLATANARYSHSALGLRWLQANLPQDREQVEILEFVLGDWPESIVEAILSHQPKIVGLGVYIWNVDLMGQVCDLLKAIHPQLPLVLGGPEMICAQNLPAFADQADYVVSGPGERAFADICHSLLPGKPPPADLRLPYSLYSDEDIAHRVLYIESSRGCPFGCEFCLSALDQRVERFAIDAVLAELAVLWQRGARRFKFVDRSLHLADSTKLLNFFLARKEDPHLFVHFELVPEALSDSLLAQLAEFLPGSLQLEVGVQSFDAEVCARIGRRISANKVEQVLGQLLSKTQAHLHADLVAGLPGEGWDSFRAGFDSLHALAPHEIQVGILKRLRGALIDRHSESWQMRYRNVAPYDVMQTSALSFLQLQRLKRFARVFDRVANSGNFQTTAQHLLAGPSAFDAAMTFSDTLFARTGQASGWSLKRLSQELFDYLCQEKTMPAAEAANCLVHDFATAGRTRGLPDEIRRQATVTAEHVLNANSSLLGSADRQARHH